MQIIINNQIAVIKSGTSFEYVSENRLFGGGDDYTFAITLPLAGCPRNQAIFGHLNRADVVPNKIRYDCEIRCRNFVRFGTVTVTEVTEQNIKVQFLAGRSEQNFDDTWDKVYINELTLGCPAISSPSGISPETAWDPVQQNYASVALPWVNNDSGILHNCADFADGKYSWSADTKGLSWQPYLLYITKQICKAMDYNFDFSAWEAKEEYKNLLVCNCLPDAWDLNDYARALPHWTVDEYFEKLELFLRGEFDIDHRERKISFAFTSDILQAKDLVRLDNVIDSFTSQLKDKEKNSEYLEARNLAYKECDLNMYKFYMCDKIIKGWTGKFVSYDTLSELLSQNKYLRTYLSGLVSRRGSNYYALLYAKDVDLYFIIRAIDRKDNTDPDSIAKYKYRCVLQPVNMFGGRIVDDSDDADKTEVEFVPAAIDFTEDKYGYAIFLNLSGYNESKDDTDDPLQNEESSEPVFQKPWIQKRFEADRTEDNVSEYYSHIFVGWYDGVYASANGHFPFPRVQNISIASDWTSWSWLHFNLRLNDPKAPGGKVIHKIDTQSMTTFKFISDSMPDVRAVFHINGRRYVCEKITATISDDGMSQLMKGEFWPIVD